MATVNSALEKLKCPVEPRAYETIVFSSKLAKAHNCALLESKFAKQLVGQLEDTFAGKNARQIELELFVRKPKLTAKPLTNPVVPVNPHNAVSAAVMRLRDVSAVIQDLDADVITAQDRAELIDHAQAILNWLGAGE
jgi:hypothetical protein